MFSLVFFFHFVCSFEGGVAHTNKNQSLGESLVYLCSKS